MELRFQRIISADSHVIEPSNIYWDALGEKFGDRTPRFLDEWQGRKGRFFFDGRQAVDVAVRDERMISKVTPRMREAGYIPEARVAYQEEDHIEAEVLNPQSMRLILRGVDREVVRASARAYNDWLAEFCACDTRRLIGTAAMPIDDVGWAVGELERVTNKGLRGAMIPIEAPEDLPPYRDPVYDPFWAAAQEMGSPISMHILGGSRFPNPAAFTTSEEKGEGVRTLMLFFCEIMWVLANEFICGGILDRFPKLKLVDSEFDISWIPWFMNRLGYPTEQLTNRLSMPMPQMRASDYMRTRIWHGFIDDPYALDVIPHIGADQILWGTDFPHEESVGLGAQEIAARIVGGLPREDQEKVVGGNAAKVWGL